MKNNWIKRGLPVPVYIKGTLEGLAILVGCSTTLYLVSCLLFGLGCK